MLALVAVVAVLGGPLGPAIDRPAAVCVLLSAVVLARQHPGSGPGRRPGRLTSRPSGEPRASTLPGATPGVLRV